MALRPLLQKLGIAVAGVLLTVCMLEVFLRLAGFAASNIYVRHENGLLTFNPNSKIRIRESCFANTIETNDRGFHSRSHDSQKADDVFRIAVIGDSFVEANQVPIDQTFFALLEDMLNKMPNRKYRYEVEGFGISSHGTYGNLRYFLEYARDFDPDLVINLFVSNDPTDDFQFSDVPAQIDTDGSVILHPAPLSQGDLMDRLAKSLKKIVRKSVLATTLRTSLMRARQAPADGAIEVEEGMFKTKPDVIWQDTWNREDLLMRTFADEVKKEGAKLVLVSATDGYRVHDDLIKKLIAQDAMYQDPKSYDWDAPEKQLATIAGRYRIPYLPLVPVFRDRAITDLNQTIWPCDGHWNGVGHRWAAEAIAQFLSTWNELISHPK